MIFIILPSPLNRASLNSTHFEPFDLTPLMTLLLGPPGCGKITLLLALAGKLNQSLKIRQGAFGSVFRARDLDTGKIVALKKVRFDNFDPESVRFMAWEIQILHRLDHPNIIKLEGLITSRLSCSMYLVFEYMEHDLAGLSSCPDINFSESQVIEEVLRGDHKEKIPVILEPKPDES